MITRQEHKRHNSTHKSNNVPRRHRPSRGAVHDTFLSDFWWTNWHWGKFRSESLGFLLSATTPLMLHIHYSTNCSVYSGPVTCLSFRRHIPSPLKEQSNTDNVARSHALYTSSSDNLTSWHDTIRSERFYRPFIVAGNNKQVGFSRQIFVNVRNIKFQINP